MQSLTSLKSEVAHDLSFFAKPKQGKLTEDVVYSGDEDDDDLNELSVPTGIFTYAFSPFINTLSLQFCIL